MPIIIQRSLTILFGFLMILYFFHWTVYCDTITKETAEVPFKAFCSKSCKELQEPFDGNFPLYQCSCSRSCSVYGDCCLDSKYRKEISWHKTEYVCLSVIGRGTYRAIYGCPPDQPSNFCADGLGHLPPVTSRVTNITYANTFCAACNGDGENLVTWHVELSCSSNSDDEVEDSDPKGTNKIIYSFGDIWRLNETDGSKRLCMYRAHYGNFSFLEGLELRSCFNPRKISECSASWRDLSTMQMCRSYSDPVYFQDTLYQNSHCALCNFLNPTFADCMPFRLRVLLRMGLAGGNVARFCENRGSTACVHSLVTTGGGSMPFQKGRPYAFADLLKISEESCVPGRGKRCCEGEVFDFRSQRCRNTVRG